MFKKYDPRLVRSYRSYKISDLCRLYRCRKLHAQTIRGWIKSNRLDSFSDGKNIFIYGAIFKQFLSNSNSGHKRCLKFNQFRCGKCKTISIPKGNCITKLIKDKRGCLLASGVCTQCGHEIHRFYKAHLEQKILETFINQHDEANTLCDHRCSTNNANDQHSLNKALSESSSIEVGCSIQRTPTIPNNTQQKTKKSKRSSSNTHITAKQLTLF